MIIDIHVHPVFQETVQDASTIPELARHLRCLADGPPQPGRMKQLRAGLRRLDTLCHQED